MYDPGIHHRRSIRLRGYDYARPGAYFVTLCADHNLDLFGQVVEGEMVTNELGTMVRTVWSEMPAHYPKCRVDVFQLMPSHMHGVLILTDPAGCQPGFASTRPSGLALPDLVHRFKSLTTARSRQRGWHRGPRLWQRDYFERVIRNATELDHIRDYIATNPVRAETDWQKILGLGI